MNLKFHKYHGTGNDFILIDHREGNIHLSGAEIARLCDRHFGIGADGLMLLTASPGYDFGMVYYNSDGRESTLCGNGGRCITAFAHQLGIMEKNARFLASDGEHLSEILTVEGNSTKVRLRMKDVAEDEYRTSNIEYRMMNERPETSSFVHRPSSFVIHTGSPHLVVFPEDVSGIDAVAEGRKLRNDPQFIPDGINVDFVQIREDGSLFVRTYERGVENETLSCGTGATAAALAVTSLQSPVRSPQSAVCTSQVPVTGHDSRITSKLVETPGGLLTVSFRQQEGSFTDIWLEGSAEFVFEGEIPV